MKTELHPMLRAAYCCAQFAGKFLIGEKTRGNAELAFNDAALWLNEMAGPDRLKKTYKNLHRSVMARKAKTSGVSLKAALIVDDALRTILLCAEAIYSNNYNSETEKEVKTNICKVMQLTLVVLTQEKNHA